MPEITVTGEKIEVNVAGTLMASARAWDVALDSWDTGSWDTAIEGPVPTPTLTVSVTKPDISL